MDAQVYILPLLSHFANCFTKPGFTHFKYFMLARMALLGMPHCVSEVMRLTAVHKLMHWTTPYAFLSRGRFSCQELSQCLLELLDKVLELPEEIILAIDDTLVKKIGKHFFGLGYYPDPTDKNPGANKRKVRGHCWVVLALLFEKQRQWFAFPLAALLFVPQAGCPKDWSFKSKIELAVMLLSGLCWPAKRLVLVVDNLYAKGKLAFLELPQPMTMISRLRSNAALYELPKKPKRVKPGRPRLRGEKVTAKQLYRRRSKHQKLKVNIYGKSVSIKAFVDILMPSRTLGAQPILVVIFPQRSGKKYNIFFSTDLSMSPVRLLELYAARFKIEDAFDEVKTSGGFADCRQRSFTALKRHATLSLLAYSLLRLLSLTIANAQAIEAEPWWQPKGAPSVTRLRRAVLKAMRVSASSPEEAKVDENAPLKRAA
jgi:hypothetical protein